MAGGDSCASLEAPGLGAQAMTREAFEVLMGRLVVLRGMPDTVDEYFTGLADIPDDLLADAVTHALRTRTWFPAPAEVRADCDAVLRSRPIPAPMIRSVALAGGGKEVQIPNPFGGDPLVLHVTREWMHSCERCRDTGWASWWCGTNPRVAETPLSSCGRDFEHASHERVAKCGCIDSNPTIQRRKAAQAKYSKAPEKAG